MKVWKVPASDKCPEGVRYRLAFIPHGQDSPAVLYDNHYPKGHHRHLHQSEEPYEFHGVNKLISNFREDVREVKGERP